MVAFTIDRVKFLEETTMKAMNTEEKKDFSRLKFVISAPRGGAISFSKRMGYLGGVGLPHTHLPIRDDEDAMEKAESLLDLYNIDDGLVRTLATVVYGGLGSNNIECAYNDIKTMYARKTFGETYSRLLKNTETGIFDPSFSMSLFPDSIGKLEKRYSGSEFIYIFRDPYFYATSVLTSVHGLDSLITWWLIEKEKNPDIELDPLEMWCCINEALLQVRESQANQEKIVTLKHPEATKRWSIEHIHDVLNSNYAKYNGLDKKIWSLMVSKRMLMSRAMSEIVKKDVSLVKSPIEGVCSWCFDITLGGDPSANLMHIAMMDAGLEKYWEKIQVEKRDLIERSDSLCRRLGFKNLSSRIKVGMK